MGAQEKNRSKLKRLAASVGQQGSRSRDATFAEGLSDTPSRQSSSGVASPHIARIAHDFNNILTLVLGYGESLLKTLPKGHPARPSAEEICRAARDGERLTLELMSLAQSGRLGGAGSTAK
jgi:hypothetical protein